MRVSTSLAAALLGVHLVAGLAASLVGGRGRVGLRRDGQFPQPLHIGEQLWSAVLDQHPAQQLAQQPDIGPQRFGHVDACVGT